MTKAPEVSQRFETKVIRAFGQLANAYHLARIDSSARSYEFVVRFSNEIVALSVKFEIGSPVWVELARMTNIEGKLTRTERYDLGLILQELGGDWQSCNRRFQSIDDPQFDQMLLNLAINAQAYADDVLRGDFSIFTRLKPLAEARSREIDEWLYGKESQ